MIRKYTLNYKIRETKTDFVYPRLDASFLSSKTNSQQALI